MIHVSFIFKLYTLFYIMSSLFYLKFDLDFLLQNIGFPDQVGRA